MAYEGGLAGPLYIVVRIVIVVIVVVIVVDVASQKTLVCGYLLSL